MSAESVGWTNNRLTLGKLSGRNAFKTRLHEIGVELDSEEALNAAFKRFKELADKKREIFDEDLHALITEENLEHLENERYNLVSLTAHSETGEQPYARLIMSDSGKERPSEAQGSGPVDAAFKAIEALVHSGAELLLYSVNAITTGTDAQGEVTVRLSKDGRIVNGQGADTDIVVASAKAYINALNRLFAGAERLNPQL
jgi:2-isopropylmalate synthase